MRMLLGCALMSLLVSVASADDTIDAKKVVGKWAPSEKKDKTVIEFTKDGKMIVTNDKQTDIPQASYTIDGNKMTTVIRFMNMEIKNVATITKLTDTEFSVKKDGSDKVETLVRIKDK